jgi:hypothetical protein
MIGKMRWEMTYSLWLEDSWFVFQVLGGWGFFTILPCGLLLKFNRLNIICKTPRSPVSSPFPLWFCLTGTSILGWVNSQTCLFRDCNSNTLTINEKNDYENEWLISSFTCMQSAKGRNLCVYSNGSYHKYYIHVIMVSILNCIVKFFLCWSQTDHSFKICSSFQI